MCINKKYNKLKSHELEMKNLINPQSAYLFLYNLW